jgi:hypothetical protein
MKYKVTVSRYFEADNSVDAVYQFFNTVNQLKHEWDSRDNDLSIMPEIDVKLLHQFYGGSK